jgi:hypothetical protein
MHVDSVPASYIVRVSADQRFKLFVNGRFAGTGPALGDPQHWRFQRIDLGPMLRPGRNVIAAVVWFGQGLTVGIAQMGVSPAFVLCPEEGGVIGDSWNQEPSVEGIMTGSANWLCYKNEAYGFLPIRKEDAPGYVAIGPMEHVDAGKYPWGWSDPDFDASGWAPPTALERARPRDYNDGPGDGWRFLEASPIPPLDITPEPLGDVVRVEGGPATESLPITIPAHARVKILIDHRIYTTANVTLTVHGGAGAVVRLRYAEALVDAKGEKGNRNEIQGKHCRGYADEFVLDGPRRTFEPLFWRSFRFIQVEVEGGDSAVTIQEITTDFTGAPIAPSARIEASDPTVEVIWKTGVRTLRCNAHEIFTDGPYWEQLSYVGDARLAALTAFAIAGSRAAPFVRNELYLFDASRIPEGITQSRYPSREMQLIPPYSLWYISMVHDYWMNSDTDGDEEFVRGLLPGIYGILNWFLTRLNENGLLGVLPWWNFVDWSFKSGVPPGATDAAAGGSSMLTLQLILGLQAAATMEECLGNRDLALIYRRASRDASLAVRTHCWDQTRGLVADTPLSGGSSSSYSQHATALAILEHFLFNRRHIVHDEGS